MQQLHIKNATLVYDKKTIFSELNLSLTLGKWTALLGPSGIGKSSLLRFIAGLSTAHAKTSGNVMVDNQQIAYLAQHDSLLPWLTVLENTTLKLKLRAHSSCERNLEQQKAKALLANVGLCEYEHAYPHELSGGMRQRVMLARTLLENKPIILMDEPFAALDAITRYKLQTLAAQLLKNKTVLFVTHDPTEALRLANDIYLLQGNPAQLKWMTHVTAAIPREPNHPEIIHLQPLLLQALIEAGEAA